MSSQVSWWECHLFIERLVAQANYSSIPVAGTPEWVALCDGDPRKLLALAQFGVHHALRVETAQEAASEASRAIADSADWPALARRVGQGRGRAYIPRRDEGAA